MATFTYNDMRFTVARGEGDRWDIAYAVPSGREGVAAAGLFGGLSEGDATAKARALVATIFPVGIKCVGPDVLHPNTIGDLKIVGPDVTHPNFIYWDKESTSFPADIPAK